MIGLGQDGMGMGLHLLGPQAVPDPGGQAHHKGGAEEWPCKSVEWEVRCRSWSTEAAAV